jgi:hypothetical protein
VLSEPQATLFGRVARRELVSIRFEIRALLYGGILLLTSGVGVLIAAHHEQIGPLALSVTIGLAAAGCLAWVARAAPPFSWGEVPSPSLVFDYVLLLGVLLFAADLAYVEAQFSMLGPRWPHHLLVVAAAYLVAAYRWDSRTVLGLGLSALAAWRGVTVTLGLGLVGPGRMLSVSPGVEPGALRASAVTVGVLYLAAAVLSVRLGRKAHFETVYAPAGLILLMGALLSGTLDDRAAWPAWLASLLVVAGLVVWVSVQRSRSLYFALAVGAAYAGLLRPLFAPFRHRESGLPFLLAALLGVGGLVLIFTAHRRMRER